MNAILLIIGIVYRVCRIVIKSVQQCTYFLFSVNLLLAVPEMRVLIGSIKITNWGEQ
jgi:hypothetical protein